jgi:hypothetical protein
MSESDALVLLSIVSVVKAYEIRFRGCPLGRLTTYLKEDVVLVVEAESVEAAQLRAYDTHEHIVGGVSATEVAIVGSVLPKGVSIT